MDRDGAIGFLVVGSLNLLPFDEEHDDEDFPGCCTKCCGPCAALKWLLDNDKDQVNEWIRASGYHIGGWVFWDEDQGGINKDLVESIWARRKGCGISNGMPIPCVDEEEDGEDPDGPQ